MDETGWLDPDRPLMRALSRYGADLPSGPIGGLVQTVHRLPVGSPRVLLEQELEATGQTRVIVDVTTGDHLVVGEVDPELVKRLVAEEMRRSPHRPALWPPAAPGSFPLISSWSYPYGRRGRNGHELFLRGSGSRPMRVFIAPEVLAGSPAAGCLQLIAHLRDPNLHTLLLDGTELPTAAVVERVRFVADEMQRFEGVVHTETTSSTVERGLRATDAVRLCRAMGPTYYRHLPDDDAEAQAEDDALIAHIAESVEADILVTTRDMLLAHPDGFTTHTAQVSPADALVLVALYLRQRDTYVMHDPEAHHRSVAADRSHFLRAAARGLIPSLHAWREMLARQPHTDHGDLGLLGESLEQRVARAVGQRDEMLAALLVRQDTNTAFRAMEHADAVLTNLQAAFDITATAAEVLAAEGEPRRNAGVAWHRRGWAHRFLERHQDLAEVLDERTRVLLEVVAVLRNTVHSEMLRPGQHHKESHPRSGVTLAEFHPRNLTEFRARIDELGECDEWGCEFTERTVLIDVRRFLGKALPLVFVALEGILTWLAHVAGEEPVAADDLEFGDWLPARCAEQLGIGEAWAPQSHAAFPALDDHSAPLTTTAVLGEVDLGMGPTAAHTRVVYAGRFPDHAIPKRDFDVGDRVGAEDMLLQTSRQMRVASIHFEALADGTLEHTVGFTAHDAAPSVATPRPRSPADDDVAQVTRTDHDSTYR